MKSRPTLFLSGVSHEFGSFRDAVENEIEMKGCFAENQPGFPPDYRTVEEMLRRKLRDSDAVIHIVGFRFGAEPNQRPADKPRRSYTQMEFDIAREMQKPVYVFLSKDATVRQPPAPDEKPEDTEATALQLAHRDAVTKTNHLYYFFKDQAELCKLVAEIPVVAAAGFNADISRILKYAPGELIGREAETKILDDAWLKVRRAESHRPHVLTFVALGGEGKTSLVSKWAASLADDNWPGCDAVFAWSFYSQGTREQTAVSSDLFLAEALAFFGDAAMAGSAQGAFEKGKRLAQLVGERRALLILDGLEPLQYAPTSPTPGELKDQGLSALLKGLAATSHGLCVVTTRYALPDLRAFLGRTVREEKLVRLARAAGVQLLKAHGVTGSDRRNLPLHDGDANSEPVSEFEKLVEDVDGHALTLHIMGSFLKKAFGGDIRKRARVTFTKASQKTDNGHAFRAMATYARWMEDGSDEARRELAILRLMGLFDRPATADCLAALLAAPAIPGLTEPLAGLPEDDWNCSLESLVAAKLLSVSPETVSVPASAFPLPASLDAHPLIREYFAERLKDEGRSVKAEGTPPSSFIPPTSSFCLAHRRLYEHLCASTQEGDQPTLEALQPLYQAVAHGCQAGLQQEAWQEVEYPRILQRGTGYSIHILGALGTELSALANYFNNGWRQLSPALSSWDKTVILSGAGYCLRSLGRLIESLDVMRGSVDAAVEEEDWRNAALCAGNLSELELTLGEVAGAVGDAEQSVTYADRSGDAFERMGERTTHADALHQAGRRAEAEARFREAEQMQAESQPAYPIFPSPPNFNFCELLLASVEQAAWRVTLGLDGRLQSSDVAKTCQIVGDRARKTLSWDGVAFQATILSPSLDHLTLGRAALYAAILESPSSFILPTSSLDSAVSGLRHAGQQNYLPLGLLTRAWCFFAKATTHKQLNNETQAQTAMKSAQEDLDEAWEIAERGPMPLFLADVHLYRARLFFREDEYPWESPRHDLAEARRLILKHGYLRRMPELEDAERAILRQ